MLKVYTEYLKTFFKDEEGASAVEYGLIVGLIAVALIVVLLAVGGGLTDVFNAVVTAVGAATASATP
ncbi:Flp family type IVb pilin [Sinimarinibacterium thermocellulolyticum]|uniref:Flp family type IVb pilin n=1 Tax=Sinimarinibacterium thermocellulolyticum TaxID=3170016 RepID=A0ABV2A6I3_9GAMM